MRKTFLTVIAAALLMCVSCKKQASVNEVVVDDETDTLTMVTDSTGNAFTGEVWDEDHRMCQETDKGRLTRVTIYHENGQKAFECGIEEDGTPKEGTFYNEKGEVITPQQFGNSYKEIIKKYGWAL